MTHPVLAEAIRKAAVAWVSADGGPARALWCAALEDAVHVVSGPGEQSAPGLADATTAEVSLRGDHGGRIVTWTARVHRLIPGTEQWAALAPQLAAKRLNAPGSAADLVARWERDGCAVVALSPADDTAQTGTQLPDSDGSAPPRETPARVPVRRPFRLHRVRRPPR